MVAPSDQHRSEFRKFDVLDKLVCHVDSETLLCRKVPVLVHIKPAGQVVHDQTGCVGTDINVTTVYLCIQVSQYSGRHQFQGLTSVFEVC